MPSASAWQPIFGGDRPTLVIPPAAADFQVSRRKTFASKTRPPDECNGGGISRLNVGLDAVQLEHAESVTKNQSHAFSHVALSGIGCADPEPEIGAAECAIDDLRDVEDPDDDAIVPPAKEQSLLVGPPC